MFTKYLADYPAGSYQVKNQNLLNTASWAQHIVINIPEAEFNTYKAKNPQVVWNITTLNKNRFNELFARVEELPFKPDFLFSNIGELQNWKNFHIHAVAGMRTNAGFWSVLDNIHRVKFSEEMHLFGQDWPYTLLSGTRSFKDHRIEEVYAIDITDGVTKFFNRNKINYRELVHVLHKFTAALQTQPYEEGTLVLIPQQNAYKVIYILRQIHK